MLTFSDDDEDAENHSKALDVIHSVHLKPLANNNGCSTPFKTQWQEIQEYRSPSCDPFLNALLAARRKPKEDILKISLPRTKSEDEFDLGPPQIRIKCTAAPSAPATPRTPRQLTRDQLRERELRKRMMLLEAFTPKSVEQIKDADYTPTTKRRRISRPRHDLEEVRTSPIKSRLRTRKREWDSEDDMILGDIQDDVRLQQTIQKSLSPDEDVRPSKPISDTPTSTKIRDYSKSKMHTLKGFKRLRLDSDSDSFKSNCKRAKKDTLDSPFSELCCKSDSKLRSVPSEDILLSTLKERELGLIPEKEVSQCPLKSVSSEDVLLSSLQLQLRSPSIPQEDISASPVLPLKTLNDLFGGDSSFKSTSSDELPLAAFLGNVNSQDHSLPEQSSSQAEIYNKESGNCDSDSEVPIVQSGAQCLSQTSTPTLKSILDSMFCNEPPVTSTQPDDLPFDSGCSRGRSRNREVKHSRRRSRSPTPDRKPSPRTSIVV